LAEHADVTRRYFLRQGLAGGLGAIAFTGASAAAQEKPPATAKASPGSGLVFGVQVEG
jgi:hypothetical protein